MEIKISMDKVCAETKIIFDLVLEALDGNEISQN